MQTFQINDEDGNSIGLLITSEDSDTVNELYSTFCTSEQYDDVQGDIEEFISYCQEQEPEAYFERFYLDDIIYPPQN